MADYFQSQHAYGGKPLYPDNGAFDNIQMGGGKAYVPNPLRGPKRMNQCVEITKKGIACRSPRCKGTELCIGHLKALKAKQKK